MAAATCCWRWRQSSNTLSSWRASWCGADLLMAAAGCWVLLSVIRLLLVATRCRCLVLLLGAAARCRCWVLLGAAVGCCRLLGDMLRHLVAAGGCKRLVAAVLAAAICAPWQPWMTVAACCSIGLGEQQLKSGVAAVATACRCAGWTCRTQMAGIGTPF